MRFIGLSLGMHCVAGNSIKIKCVVFKLVIWMFISTILFLNYYKQVIKYLVSLKQEKTLDQ